MEPLPANESAHDETTLKSGARAIFAQMQDRTFRRTDRMFERLLIVQWIVATAVVIAITPSGWFAVTAIVLGAMLTVAPLVAIRRRPGAARQAVAVVHMAWSALPLALTNGRIEAYVLVIGSLTLLSFYRDWKLLVIATVVAFVVSLIASDGARILETAIVVGSVNAILMLGYHYQRTEMRASARREASLVLDVGAGLLDVWEQSSKLDERNTQMAFVLDNVDQGLFTVTLAGAIAEERSAAVDRLLGPIPAAGTIQAYVDAFAPAIAPWFELCWSTLRDQLLPAELALDQLPQSFTVNGRQLELAYKLVNAGSRRHVLIVVTDVTARIAREEAQRDQREVAAVAARLIADRQGFRQWHAEIADLLEDIVRDVDHNAASLRSPIHTIKGIAPMFGLGSIADLCHRIEDAIDAGVGLEPLVQRLVDRWRHLEEQLRPLTAVRTDRVEVELTDLADLVAALSAMPNSARLVAMVEGWKHEPVRSKLERLGEQVQGLAARLGKEPVEVEVACDGTRLPAETGARFWSSLVHVVRNSIDHGLETSEERAVAGKPPTAKVALRATQGPGGLVVEIADHGRGIDWGRVAEVARAAGVPSETHDDLVDALFREGVTSKSEASETSGRGIGLGAVKHACLELGGTISVASNWGQGTTFTFTFPALGLDVAPRATEWKMQA